MKALIIEENFRNELTVKGIVIFSVSTDEIGGYKDCISLEFKEAYPTFKELEYTPKN